MYRCVLLGILSDRHQRWAKSLSLRSGQPSSSLGVGKLPNLSGRGAHVDVVPSRIVAGDKSATGGARLHAETGCATSGRSVGRIARQPCGIRLRGSRYIEIDIDLDITKPTTYRLTFRYPLYRDRYIDLAIANQHTPNNDSIPDQSISTIFTHTCDTCPICVHGTNHDSNARRLSYHCYIYRYRRTPKTNWRLDGLAYSSNPSYVLRYLLTLSIFDSPEYLYEH